MDHLLSMDQSRQAFHYKHRTSTPKIDAHKTKNSTQPTHYFCLIYLQWVDNFQHCRTRPPNKDPSIPLKITVSVNQYLVLFLELMIMLVECFSTLWGLQERRFADVFEIIRSAARSLNSVLAFFFSAIYQRWTDWLRASLLSSYF